MDLLSEAFDLIAARLGLPREALAEIERTMRQQKGGDRYYIASARAMDIEARHSAIWHALQAGATPAQVAERFRISRKHVYEVAARRRGLSPPLP